MMPYDRDIEVNAVRKLEEELYHAKMGNGRSEVKQTQISAQCANLAEQSEILAKLVQELEDRLNVVLRPANDERGAMKSNELPPEPLAPHADFLQTRVNLLMRVGDSLAGIIQRIEL